MRAILNSSGKIDPARFFFKPRQGVGAILRIISADLHSLAASSRSSAKKFKLSPGEKPASKGLKATLQQNADRLELISSNLSDAHLAINKRISGQTLTAEERKSIRRGLAILKKLRSLRIERLGLQKYLQKIFG